MNLVASGRRVRLDPVLGKRHLLTQSKPTPKGTSRRRNGFALVAPLALAWRNSIQYPYPLSYVTAPSEQRLQAKHEDEGG